jgi:HK97 gp10 family phage protein
MELKVKVEIKGELLKKLTSQPADLANNIIRAGMISLVEAVEAKGVQEAPVKTSNLVGKITSNVSADGRKGEIRSTAPYSKYVHEGTGLFGPFKTLIKPTTKKALFWPGALHPVKSVKGMKPNPFFTRALARVNPQEVFEAGVFSYLRSI